MLNNENFFSGGELSVKMIQPASYVKADHDEAEERADSMLEDGEKLSGKQTSAYSKLSTEVPVEYETADGITKIKIPALNPWAILILSKDDLTKN